LALLEREEDFRGTGEVDLEDMVEVEDK